MRKKLNDLPLELKWTRDVSQKKPDVRDMLEVHNLEAHDLSTTFQNKYSK